MWSVGQRSETGYVRSENQDRMSWIRAPACDVFVVSDGMGGHAGGALAAQLTVQTLQERLSGMTSVEDAGATLERAFQAANEAVYERGQTGSAATARMGATAVALLAAGPRIMLAHVGDSRAYRLTRGGVLERLTKDHSLVQRMVDAGMLTEAQAADHPDSSVLERAMGQAPRVEVEVSAWRPMRAGEVCMLCSDGLCGYVGDDEIAAVMRGGQPPQDMADQLVRLALERGGEDNVTVQVLQCNSGGSLLRRWLSRSALARFGIGVPVVIAALWLGWSGVLSNRSSQGNRADGAPASASLGSVPAAVPSAPAPAAATAGALPSPIEARVAALERDARNDAAEHRARDASLAQQIESLTARIDQLDRKASAPSAASTPATSRARKPAKSAKKPEQQASTVAASASTPASTSPAPAAAESQRTPPSEPVEAAP
jgi:serine/threonine protein phosphatase PrpC